MIQSILNTFPGIFLLVCVCFNLIVLLLFCLAILRMRRMQEHTISSYRTSPLPKSTCPRRNTRICLANHGNVLFWHFIFKTIIWIELNWSFCPLLSLRQILDKIVISSVSANAIFINLAQWSSNLSFPFHLPPSVRLMAVYWASQSWGCVKNTTTLMFLLYNCHLNIIMRKKELKN